MISFRHHLLTIVAIFLALAVGVVLGGGPLADVGARVPDSSSEPERRTVDTGAAASYGESFAAAVTPALTSGRLEGRDVALVTLPGSDEQVVTALTDLITSAGGSVSGRYALAAEMVDPSQKSLVDSLGSQLVSQQPDGVVSAEATAYDRMGELLGLAIASTSPEGDEINGKSRAVVDALVGADLITAPEDVERRAPLVLLVLGSDSEEDGGDAILSGLAAGLARQAAGVVAAGTAADGDGQLGRFRTDPVAATVTTVDGTDTAPGRAATVLALARALSEKGGSFGASGADGPVPLG